MAGQHDYDLSELEMELESDLDQEFDLETDDELAGDEELELFEARADDFETGGEFEADEEADLDELEMQDSETDGLESPSAEYGERLSEIDEREFESPGSMDAALYEVLDEMGRDYFLKRAWGRLKKRVPGITRLVNRGMQLAKAAGINIPMLDSLKNMSGLAQSLLQGNLSGVAKHAMSAALKAHPGAAAAMPALKALGFESDDPVGRRRAWHNFAEVAREAYENLAESLNETAVQPAQAMQLAQKALQHGMRRVPLRTAVVRTPAAPGVRSKGRTRVVTLVPGERLLVVVRRRPGR